MKYFDDWRDSKIEGLREDFDIRDKGITDEQILFAAYSYENYSGTAFVLFKRDGQLFEVNGSHCSCYGLENQWAPEATSWEALKGRTEDIYGLPSFSLSALETLISEQSAPEKE